MENNEIKIIKKTSVRNLNTKKYKLPNDIDLNCIRVSIDVKYNNQNERKRKILISKLRGTTDEVIHFYEFFCEDLNDLHVIEKHLVSLGAGHNTLRCVKWITNKLDLKIESDQSAE